MHQYMAFGVRFCALLAAVFVVCRADGKNLGDTVCERALIPDVYTLNNVQGFEPQQVTYQVPFSSPGMTDSWLALGRRVVAFPDFKFIADLQRRDLSEAEKRAEVLQGKKFRRNIFERLIASGMAEKKAIGFAQRAYARWMINHLYTVKSGLLRLETDATAPRWTVKDERYAPALNYIEETWPKLARLSPAFSSGSLLPSPFPVLIAGGRFREAYYWDAYFGALGLVATDRTDLAAAQLENFLHMIQIYGKVPNGFRDYYLSRSQPPVISMMTMLIYNQRPNKKWLVERAYPLLQHDYHNFWMKQRLDPRTGLNFYSDDLNEQRPERHSSDDDRTLGHTFRDVRAHAESGLDFTDALMSETSRVASVSLNALMYRYELDLAAMAEIAGDSEAAAEYKLRAERRQTAVNKYLWDVSKGVYRNTHLDTGVQSAVVHADLFAALYVGMASPDQARLVKERALVLLERDGGLASSTSQSGKQWDGNHGWAPLHVMAIQGLANYGFKAEAARLARKWVDSLSNVFAATGTFFEKIDVDTSMVPVETGEKYPNQTGFLWTNASYVWALKFLGVPFVEKGNK